MKAAKRVAKKTSAAPRSRRVSNGGDGAAARYFLLDMGREQYGDCVLCLFGDRSVLIDAGHPSDFAGQDGYESIPEQLTKILGVDPPFKLDVLVITHGHNDHIGCLPSLAAEGTIKPRYAIVADPDLAFPPGYRDALTPSDDPGVAPDLLAKVVAGLLEEDHSHLPDAQLDLFLDAAAKLGSKYRDAVEALESAGTTIFKWGSSDPTELGPIYRLLSGTGFDIIGPSLPQLEICRDQIVAYAKKAKKAAEDSLAAGEVGAADEGPTAARVYKHLLLGDPRLDAEPLIDRKGSGSALNCQSIVIKFGEGDRKVLLAGDMQFAESEVDGLEAELADLRKKVVQAGPFRFVKMTHHTSYNGIDTDLWKDLGSPPLLAHSGGLNDDAHPEPGALAALKALGDEILFARTDRNGLITVEPSRDGENAIKTSRGSLNNFAANVRKKAKDEPSSPTAGIERRSERPAGGGPTYRPERDYVDVIFVRLPYEDGEISVDGHTISIRGRGRTGPERQSVPDRPAPPRSPPSSGGTRPKPAATGRLADGRDLTRILFVTDKAKLEDNIGELEANKALQLINDGGCKLLQTDGASAEGAVRGELASGRYDGVVIVGGYDVVPSQRVDVLDPALRRSIPRKAIVDDRDEFIVWSDDIYGDADGDGLAEFPVSRIPDGKTPSLVFTALTAKKPGATGERFGIGNAARPFSVPVFEELPGRRPFLRSAPTRFRDIGGAAQQQFLYFMLHGLDSDGSRFWGDGPTGAIEAINTGCVPSSGLGVVLAGCCWGALTVDQRAKDTSGVVSPKTPGGSMALSILSGGALAYVGCTGVHYSPGQAGDFFGGPMHMAFWTSLIKNDFLPAKALFEARKQFLAGMPHGRQAPLELAIERKIYKQFTCLGLAW